jgi:hypothetical protein
MYVQRAVDEHVGDSLRVLPQYRPHGAIELSTERAFKISKF